MENFNRRAILGIILVLIGGVLLLENLDLIPDLPRWIMRWPMLLILLGIVNLVSGNRSAAIILTGIGSFFLLKDIYYLSFRDIWPVILIIIGAALLFRQKAQSKGASTNENFFDALNIFGGGNQRVTSQQLEGGKITSIFGGAEIDLRESVAKNGASIDIFTMFGGVDITVPPSWKVKVEVMSILGGFTDKRSHTVYDENSPTVIIKGMAILGGGEVKS